MQGGEQGWVGRALSSWKVRSLLIGGVASVVDLCILLTMAKLLGLAAPIAAACGVAVGATANFLLNRRFTFSGHGQPITSPALRFAAGTAVLIAIHAAVVLTLTDMRAPLLAAKYGADISVLLGGNLLLLRYFVFPAPKPELQPQPAVV